ncbi:MAG: hypothetical protein A2W08_18575 [Candidatus Rokubacteria bacterium RBG_16_73_20]|nr:MAG: hypothetical protein A2W08_18575 [Candidatus Rokubacteria bacterium RBG_16_73_20]HBH00976.1 hypothetical protein [Candidatus Rokubacteria bacterium]
MLYGMKHWAEDRYDPGPYRELAPAYAVHRAIQLLIDRGLLRLDAHSAVFEPGCNRGRNLQILRDRYGCAVLGMDCSPGAVREASVPVRQDNVLTSAWLAELPPKSFDVVLTRWHLVHLPPSAAKIAYVEQLKRLGKAVVLFEPSIGALRVEVTPAYTLAYEDWVWTYGFRLVEDIPPMNGDTRCFLFPMRPE